MAMSSPGDAIQTVSLVLGQLRINVPQSSSHPLLATESPTSRPVVIIRLLPTVLNILRNSPMLSSSLCAAVGFTWTWGSGKRGQLGLGPVASAYLPQRVEALV